MIVRLVVSHFDELAMFGSLLVKTTPHDTSLVTETLTVELVVDRVTGDEALLSANVSAARSTVPLQVRPE